MQDRKRAFNRYGRLTHVPTAISMQDSVMRDFVSLSLADPDEPVTRLAMPFIGLAYSPTTVSCCGSDILVPLESSLT